MHPKNASQYSICTLQHVAKHCKLFRFNLHQKMHSRTSRDYFRSEFNRTQTRMKLLPSKNNPLNIREFLLPRLDVLMQNLSYFLIAKPTSIFPWAFAYSHHARMCYNEKSSQTKSAVSLGRKRLVMFTPEGYFCHMPIIIFIVSFFRKLILLGIFTKIFIGTFFCFHNFV